MIKKKLSYKKSLVIHLLVSYSESNVSSSLPAIHGFSGCDLTSKMGPKHAALRKSMDLDLLHKCGVDILSKDTLTNAEIFLVLFWIRIDSETLDQLRLAQYHDTD